MQILEYLIDTVLQFSPSLKLFFLRCIDTFLHYDQHSCQLTRHGIMHPLSKL